METETESFSAASFFASQAPPEKLEEELAAVKGFVDMHAKEGRKVVLVTSGGTTVPLEHNVVRFLDNFSAGTRGSSSAEHFLRTGEYAVIFMHRQHSLQPFSRHYSHSTNPFLDLLDVSGPGGANAGLDKGKGREMLVERKGSLFPALPPLPPAATASPRFQNPPLPSTATNNTSHPIQRTQTPSQSGIHIPEPQLTPMLTLLRSYKLVRQLGLLHTITFTTVNEYLWLLRGVAKVMGEEGGLGRKGMFYLAAAVSDFFVPQEKMSEHKIQSGQGSLHLEMYQVPKVLASLTSQWSSHAYIISFKLETDPAILIPKARASIERYGHQVVIANELNTRKEKVVFVEKGKKEDWVYLKEGGEEIEEEIVKKLVEMHKKWIEEGENAKVDARVLA